jgi:hypothetical protein
MDVTIDPEQSILVNNRPADLDTLVYENFSIEWNISGYGVAPEEDARYREEENSTADEDTGFREEENSTADEDTGFRETENSTVDEDDFEEADAEEGLDDEDAEPETVNANAVEKRMNPCIVMVNGAPVTLFGKERYIFVDIFDRISFDLRAGGGRAIVTLLNGRDAQYTEELHEGDRIELYWEEKK